MSPGVFFAVSYVAFLTWFLFVTSIISVLAHEKKERGGENDKAPEDGLSFGASVTIGYSNICSLIY
ncbi:hypothetical protein FH503_15865 [Bacillus velezensis]|nr:hypothetical protein EG882_20195 [Bacillus velezensis]QCC35207.1 hypothetical protein E4T61_04170 [Bacillus velezensis]TNU47385.1 hypothetical protein FH503_15865 [Bacillus velezensis]TNU62029.1 hypothetical protein FH504_15525 [Bacillus velezensis]TNU70389.1 hypothetical protein FH506_17815 [Bacillus velezensis]